MKVKFLVVILSVLTSLGLFFVFNKKNENKTLYVLDEITSRILIKSTNLTIEFEGFNKNTYKCPAGQKTLGFGSVNFIKKYGDNKFIDEQDYKVILLQDQLKIYFNIKYKYFSGIKLQEDEISSLIAFVYNVGETNFYKYKLKTILEKYFKNRNNSSLANSVKKEWLGVNKYVNTDGFLVVSTQLKERRKEEVKLFFLKK